MKSFKRALLYAIMIGGGEKCSAFVKRFQARRVISRAQASVRKHEAKSADWARRFTIK
jgi:hypothetical protein